MVDEVTKNKLNMTTEERKQIYIKKIIDRLSNLDLSLLMKIYDMITYRK